MAALNVKTDISPSLSLSLFLSIPLFSSLLLSHMFLSLWENKNFI